MLISNFSDYLSKEKKFSNNTIVAYVRDVDTFKNFCFENHNLKKRINDYLTLRDSVKSNSDCFFITKKGKKIGPSLVYRVVKNYFSKVSTKVKTSPHVLRHSFATHMLNNGADINSIKEIMGHSSLASTQIYTKIKLPKIVNDYKKNHPREKKK